MAGCSSAAPHSAGHVTDRYTKAVGQLGDESPSVRVGGVYALERVPNDSAKDRTTIVYVLRSFIREPGREPNCVEMSADTARLEGRFGRTVRPISRGRTEFDKCSICQPE